MVLDDIHNLIRIQPGSELSYGLPRQLKQQVRLLIVVYLRVIYKLIHNDTFRDIRNNSALTYNNVNIIFLLPQFPDENLLCDRLIIQVVRIQIKVSKTRPYIIGLLDGYSWNFDNIAFKLIHDLFIDLLCLLYHFSGKQRLLRRACQPFPDLLNGNLLDFFLLQFINAGHLMAQLRKCIENDLLNIETYLRLLFLFRPGNGVNYFLLLLNLFFNPWD